ncbi:MAG: transporter [Bdellovibrionota bacterium]
MKIIIGVLVFLIPFSAYAETAILGFGSAEFTQDLETDRPDFTEGTQTIQAGHLQFESGYTFTNDKQAGVDTTSHGYPELLVRAGLAEGLELRIFWEGWAHSKTNDAVVSLEQDGANDMSLGFKAAISEQSGSLPSTSLIAEVGLPVGNKEFSSGEAAPAAKYLMAYDLNEIFSLASNLNLAFPVVDDDRYFELEGSLSLGIGLTENLGGYLEFYSIVPAETTSEFDQHYFNGGFTYLLNANTQLDIRAGLGINDNSDDFFTGAGLSFRL